MTFSFNIIADSEQTTADGKSQFVLVPNFSAAKPQRVLEYLLMRLICKHKCYDYALI